MTSSRTTLPEPLTFEYRYERDSREEWLSAHYGSLVVARAKIRRSFERVIIKFLTVHEDYQRQGIGRAVVAHLRQDVSEVQAKGVKYQARAFWEKLGFRRGYNPRCYIWSRCAPPPTSVCSAGGSTKP